MSDDDYRRLGQVAEFAKGKEVAEIRNIVQGICDGRYEGELGSLPDEFKSLYTAQSGSLVGDQNGVIRLFCRRDGDEGDHSIEACPLVMKHTDLPSHDFFNEVFAYLRAAHAKVGPNIYIVHVYRHAGAIIIMDRYDSDIKHVVLQPNDVHEIFDLIQRMHRCGIHHGDLFTKNILVKTVRGVRKFAVTDFGLAWLFNPGEVPLSIQAVDFVTFLYGMCGERYGVTHWCHTPLFQDDEVKISDEIAQGFISGSNDRREGWLSAIRSRINSTGTLRVPRGSHRVVSPDIASYYVTIFRSVPLSTIEFYGVKGTADREGWMGTIQIPEEKMKESRRLFYRTVESNYYDQIDRRVET